MGAFEHIAPIIIPRSEEERKEWGWDPHEQVILRGVYTAADAEAVGNATASTAKDGSIVFQLGTARIKTMEQLIQSWTFMENGKPVPVSIDAIRRLPERYQTLILTVCDTLTQRVPKSEKEQESFLPSANGHIVESFVEAK